MNFGDSDAATAFTAEHAVVFDQAFGDVSLPTGTRTTLPP